jgi:hypothetical protein
MTRRWRTRPEDDEFIEKGATAWPGGFAKRAAI